MKKGESLRDTVATIDAMGIDAVVLRHRSAGAAAQVARWLSTARVLNAGDGAHQHPTQALIDLHRFARRELEQAGLAAEGPGLELLEGLEVADHRRRPPLAGSLAARCRPTASPARAVRVAAPGTLLPASLESWAVELAEDLDEALRTADVVSVLRMQEERGSGAYVPSLHEFTATFGMTVDRAALLKPGALITHPGPMVRGVEIASAVADDPRCLVLRQVANGVPVRMAALFLSLSTPERPDA